MTTNRTATIALLLFSGLAACLHAADPASTAKSNTLMEKKLEYSEGLLKSLVRGDFDEARRNAKLMKTFTRLEQLYQGKNPEYAVQLKEFQATNAALSQAIEDKKLNDASKAYGAMIESCIKCHAVIRDES